MRREDTERSSELIDQANEAAATFLKADLANARARTAPEQHPDFDGTHCVEPNCGVELPTQRLKDGRVRCVDCQQRREYEARQYFSRQYPA